MTNFSIMVILAHTTMRAERTERPFQEAGAVYAEVQGGMSTWILLGTA